VRGITITPLQEVALLAPEDATVLSRLAVPARVINLTRGGYPLLGQGVPGVGLSGPRVARFWR